MNPLYSEKLIVEKKSEKEVYLIGFISTTEPDLVNDIVTLKCLESMMEQLKDRSLKLDIEHSNFNGDSKEDVEVNKTLIPAGKIFAEESEIVEVQTKNGIVHKLKVKSMLNPNHKDFIATKGNVEGGFLDAYSIAYIATKTYKKQIDGKTFRFLDELNLLNVALTGVPINPGASNEDVQLKNSLALRKYKADKKSNLEMEN